MIILFFPCLLSYIPICKYGLNTFPALHSLLLAPFRHYRYAQKLKTPPYCVLSLIYSLSTFLIFSSPYSQPFTFSVYIRSNQTPYLIGSLSIFILLVTFSLHYSHLSFSLYLLNTDFSYTSLILHSTLFFPSPSNASFCYTLFYIFFFFMLLFYTRQVFPYFLLLIIT